MQKISLVPKGLFNIVVAIALMCVVVATTAIVTHYPGRIAIGLQVGTNNGHIVIDGRTGSQPTLPPQK